MIRDLVRGLWVVFQIRIMVVKGMLVVLLVVVDVRGIFVMEEGDVVKGICVV